MADESGAGLLRGRCAVCGKGVYSNQPRAKDEVGRYYHASCHQQGAKAAAAPAPAPAPDDTTTSSSSEEDQGYSELNVRLPARLCVRASRTEPATACRGAMPREAGSRDEPCTAGHRTVSSAATAIHQQQNTAKRPGRMLAAVTRPRLTTGRLTDRTNH